MSAPTNKTLDLSGEVCKPIMRYINCEILELQEIYFSLSCVNVCVCVCAFATAASRVHTQSKEKHCEERNCFYC